MFTSLVDRVNRNVSNTIPCKLSFVFLVLQNMLDTELFQADATNPKPRQWRKRNSKHQTDSTMSNLQSRQVMDNVVQQYHSVIQELNRREEEMYVNGDS